MKFFKRLFRRSTPLSDVAPSVPSDLSAEISRAASLQLSGDYQAALEVCNQILVLDPNNATAYYIRGLVKFGLGDRTGASADWNKAQSLREVK